MEAHMESDIVEKARKQKAELERQLEAAKAKLQEIQAFLKVYDDLSKNPSRPRVHLIDSEKTKTEKILEVVESALQDGTPRPTRVLLDILGQRGLEVGGKDKVINLSSILSKDKRFQADRSRGWSLRKEKPEDVRPSSGFSS